jgi:hypothetical protein
MLKTLLIAVLCASVSAESDGCTTLAKSQYANATITKASLKCTMRGVVAHCGVEVETKHGVYALAQNSKTVAGIINSPGCVWCQTGGMPMHNSKANGDCKGCGGWKVAGPNKDTATGNFKTLAAFMKDVKKFNDEHPYYNIAACENKGKTANCQLQASKMYHSLTGKKASKCSACDSNCFK